MPNYGRYFEVRIPPVAEHRRARYITGDAVIPIGAPVRTTGVVNADGRSVVEQCVGNITAPLLAGKHGIALFEHAYNAYAGFDPDLTQPSDFPDIPAGSSIQLISGTECKFVLRNIETDTTFMGTRAYDDSRVMVAPANMSTVAIGDTLRPGLGANTTGHWAEATGGDVPWLVVTNKEAVGHEGHVEIEVQMLFG